MCNGEGKFGREEGPLRECPICRGAGAFDPQHLALRTMALASAMAELASMLMLEKGSHADWAARACAAVETFRGKEPL
jgi:hypothetical protein